MCSHPNPQFCRQPWTAGSVSDIVQRCPACGVNVRGAGVWVPREEVVAAGQDPDQLPTWEARRPEQDPLFPGW
jgi:hypothetical protein